jgi:hypothetical protein
LSTPLFVRKNNFSQLSLSFPFMKNKPVSSPTIWQALDDWEKSLSLGSGKFWRLPLRMDGRSL